jgi:transposase
MSNQFISDENRQRIIEAYLNGYNAGDIAKILGFKRTSIYAIIKKFIDCNEISRKQKGGPRRISLTVEDKNCIKVWIDENCGLTLDQISSRLVEEKGISVSRSTIQRCISDFNYTLKRTHLLPERRNCLEVIERRSEYAEKYMNVISRVDDANIFLLMKLVLIFR